MSWVEIALRVQGELAEPVADLLARHAQAGVLIEPTEESELGADLQADPSVWVRAWLPEDGQVNQKKQAIEEGLWHLSQICPLPPPVYQTVEDPDWEQAWKAHYHPLPVGKRFWIQPAWLEAEAASKGDRMVLLIEPGVAFGSGTHPTTQLCVEALERYVSSGNRVLDIGTGTGILAIAAVRLGASRVLAYDKDPRAVEVTRGNVQINNVKGSIHVRRGSLEEVPADWMGSADLVLANILAGVLVDMLDGGLAQFLKEDGKLILSGIISQQTPQVLDAASGVGLELKETLTHEDWQALVLAKRKTAP